MSDLLRLATAGSVDDGKSTLVGRLLYDTKSVLADQLDAVHRASVDKGLSTPDLSLLVDGLRSEREQGITIDVAYRYFATDKRTLRARRHARPRAVHPQHGDRRVDRAAGVLLVDARKGVIEQTRRHAAVLALLGVPRLVLAVNKIDLVDYDEGTFEVIAKEFAEPRGHARLPHRRGARDPGVRAASATTWWSTRPTRRGTPGRRCSTTWRPCPVDPDPHEAPFRFPVQYVIRPRTPEHPDYRGYAGQVAAGTVRPGDEVVVLPAGRADARSNGSTRRTASCPRRPRAVR